MKFENTNVYNMLEAIRAMRLSYNSEGDSERAFENCLPSAKIGPKDEKLIRSLVAEGSAHRKFMRQILLSVDITAPRYWWMQFDTYKVGVTSCSQSTMHTLMKKPIVIEDFSYDIQKDCLERLESLRKQGEFHQLVAALPQGYLQKRHVTMNYEVVRNIREQRKGHKLGEWKEFILWSDRLPRAELFFQEQ